MAQTGPTAVLRGREADGMLEVAVVDGDALVPSQPLLPLAGSDGVNTQAVKTDTAGNLAVVGTGVAGTPVGGVLTVQGDPAGTPIPVSGLVTASAPTAATSTHTGIAAAVGAIALRPALAGRKGFTVYNETNKAMKLFIGAGATTAIFTTLLGKDSYFEAPPNFLWTGALSGFFDTPAAGTIHVVEYTT